MGLTRRHIQDFTNASNLEPHWGYASRVIPCKNDAGSCQYLDVVYHSHDLGMLYSGIVWATIGGILLIWLVARTSYSARRKLSTFTSSTADSDSGVGRVINSFSSLRRRWLLPEFARSIFGPTTRLQFLVLVVLVGYVTTWSFVGIVYQKWITPVKNSTLHNTRTSLGPFADRIGLLAYALMPLSIMLSSRESILSLITGIPYQSFNFLHRWLGYIIFAQSVIHTIGWTVIETVLYQPQPKTGREWIKQKYMIWGIVAQICVTFIFVSSLPPVIRLTGYEFFRKAHYIVAMFFLGACWGHWSALSCFMIASLTIWFVDRGIRLVRTALMHHNYLPSGKMGFSNAKTKTILFPDEKNGDVVRLDFEYTHNPWKVGQHFYLCFPELSIWQSHPFTPASLPCSNGLQRHSYVIRSKGGETKNLARIAGSKNASNSVSKNKEVSTTTSLTTPVILTGPYGKNIMSSIDNNTNILCIAGGTGVTYVLPVLLSLAQQMSAAPNRKIEFVWAIRMDSNTNWIQPELEILEQAAKSSGLAIRIYITRECCTSPTVTTSENANAKESTQKLISEATEEEVKLSSHASSASISTHSGMSTHYSARPNLHDLTTSFLENTIRGPTAVIASGPAGMISDIRDVVAQKNDAAKVWKGQSRWDVRLVCDDRMEW